MSTLPSQWQLSPRVFKSTRPACPGYSSTRSSEWNNACDAHRDNGCAGRNFQVSRQIERLDRVAVFSERSVGHQIAVSFPAIIRSLDVPNTILLVTGGLIYSTGADIQFADREVVEQIVDKIQTKNYGFRSLVHEVVQSRIFLNK